MSGRLDGLQQCQVPLHSHFIIGTMDEDRYCVDAVAAVDSISWSQYCGNYRHSSQTSYTTTSSSTMRIPWRRPRTCTNCNPIGVEEGGLTIVTFDAVRLLVRVGLIVLKRCCFWGPRGGGDFLRSADNGEDGLGTAIGCGESDRCCFGPFRREADTTAALVVGRRVATNFAPVAFPATAAARDLPRAMVIAEWTFCCRMVIVDPRTGEGLQLPILLSSSRDSSTRPISTQLSATSSNHFLMSSCWNSSSLASSRH